MNCEHRNLRVAYSCNRLLTHDGVIVVGWRVVFKLNCHDCGVQFQFPSLPTGDGDVTPSVSQDGLELRLPVHPIEYLEDIKITPSPALN